ncbi:MAG: FtsW/RodA/SpoVE family cell cycle protein [Selenomonadaceae bacterium]
MNFKATILPGLLLLFGTAIIDLKKYPQLDYSAYPWILAVVLLPLLIHFWLGKKYKTADHSLFLLAMFFADLGLIMIYRLKPVLFIPQLRWVLIGLGVFLFVLHFAKNIREMVKYQYLIGLCSVILLCSTLLLGTEIGGSLNWIVIGSVQVQPSEFAKLLIILFLAAYLVDHRNVLSLPNKQLFFLRLPPLRFIAPLVVIWGLAMLMFVVQKDLGSALLFFGIALFMTYMATGNKSYVFLALIFFAISSTISYYLFHHVRVRVAIWLHPWADPTGPAYQIVQSLFAFGSGGVFGTGFAHGQPGLIPEVHTDFIFSAIGEELGLLGALAVVGAYMLFFYRSFKLSLSCRNEMEMLLSAGLAVSLALQVFIIIAGVTKLLPLTGITLPFISYGGSSMVSSFIILGLLFVLSVKENSNG